MLVSRAPELEQGDFETRALVFISQQDEKIQPALEGVLKLCRPEKEDVGKLTEAIRELAKGGGKGGSLLAAFDLHSLNATSARQFAGRKLTVLCECLLNYTMEMSEMLTEERCDLLRSIVETRSCQRVAQRFKDSTAPLTDANEHWRRELDDWRALLAPFSWKNSRAPVMSQVLLAADLCEPLTKHVQLVRSFEYLRCLGGGLIDEEMQGIIQKLQLHGEEFSCWKASEVSEEVLTAYRKSVLPAIPRTQVADMLPKEVMEAEATAKARGALRSAAEAMGFLPSALMGKIPTPVLGQLAWRLLSLVEQEGKVQLDSDLQKLCHNMAETAQMCKDNISEAPLQLCLNFLLRVGKEYLTRATPKRAAGTHLNFELLAGGSPSMQLLRNLETHPEAQRLLGNMALSELLHVASLIREAHGMVHGDSVPIFHAALEHWLARLKVDPTLHPADMSELSAALDDFLKQNCSARIAGQEEALPSCIARVLQRLAGQPHLDRQESALCLAPVGRQVERRRPESGQQKVVACFGAIPDGAATPVVVRCIPIGLNKSRGNASTGAMVGRDEYEVREVGLRSGGMYRLVTDMFSGQGGSLLDTLEDATMMYYQWVPPSEVREDSQMLQQILVTATHVRLRLPTKSKGDVAEELLIDLQTSQVTGHSSWYQVLPSKSRDSADALGGFRRLALGIGPGLRLPLPQNLFASSGIVETAEVLASLLAIWFSQRHSLEDVCEAIRQQPSLVYFTSVGLLERFDELGGIIIQALKKHWSEVLQMDQSLTHGQISEVKEILLDLLLAGPNDRLAAVLPATHLNDFCSLVKDTKFSLELLAVERFCFEAALERIAAFQQSTLTFILVEITGQISALQLSELIRTASGSIRLVFSWYPGLLPKLALTLSLGNVLLPNSLEADLGSRSAPTPYRDTFALGQATLACKMMKPAELSPLDGLDIVLQRDRSRADSSHRIDWARNLVESQNFLREAHAWACREEEWRRDVRQRAMLLLLVASDEALIQQKYEQMDGVQCFRLNHAERQVLAPVEALLDRLAHHGEATTSSKIPIIVLLGVGFITPSKLEDLVARAYVCGVRVILVAPEPLAFLRCIRVTTRLGTEYLQATILHVRSTLDSETLSLRDTQSHSFMRALQLVLGQVLPSSPPNALLLAIKAQDPAACGTALAALPAPAGRQILRADVAADLCAGILHSLSDESVEVVRVFDARSLSYATGCLVASFVARADSMELDHKVWDLSFTDFRACLPVCRFLDQVSVLESWCRYLDFVGFQAETLTAHRPQGHWFWPSQSPELRFLSQWDFENNAHSTGIEDLLEQATARLQSPESGEVPAAAYWGSGPTHQSEDPEEVLERQCLQNRELDWSAFSESWRTALDIKPSLFLQLAGLGVDTLRLFLCLPPARAIELGLTYLLDATPMSGSLASEVTRKLLRDLDCVENLLAAAASAGDHSELSSRVAAVKWLLLTVLPESFQSRSMQMTEASIQDLVRSNVMLCPRGRSDLLMRVASMLISLDGNDVLNSQHEIKRFLLETDLPLQRLLSRTSKVGRAVVSLLFCPDHAEQIKRKEVGVVLASSFKELLGYDVLTWQMGSGGEGHRLTAAAHAAVLEYAPNLQVVETLLRGPLITAISKQMTLEGAHAAEGFLCEVLENVPSSDTMVLTILTILSGEDEGVRKVMKPLSTSLKSTGGALFSSSKNPFLPSLYSALQSQSLGNYLAMVAHGTEKGRPLQLSLDSCNILQDLYIQYFRQSMHEITMASIESSYAIHTTMLDDASCAALFCKLSQLKESTPSDLALLWYCWSQSPDRQLPFWALPPASSGPIFVASLNTGIPFVERCKPMRFGLSVLAKFLVTPETLPLGVYNTLTEKAPWVHGTPGRGGSSMKVQTLLLGQEDQEEYPPYCIRWHARALPSSLRHQLLRRCHGSVQPALDTGAHDFYPRLNSGISEANLRFNLGLFLALRSNNPDLQVYFDHGADHQRQFVAGCILCWFKAAGISYRDLLECVQLESQDDFKSIWEDVHEAYSRTGPASLRRMYVRGPLPTDIDVRWIDEGSRDVPILARTRDSAVLTAQWLNMLLLHFKLPRPEPFETEDLVIESEAGLQAGNRLETALATISEAVGAALRRDLCAREPALVIALADGKFDTLQLVTRVTVLADFVLLLRTSTVPSETPLKIGHFFEQLVGALATKQDNFEPPDANIAALFDAFFLLHGLTSENEGLEIEALAKAYEAFNLPVSAQTMEEVRWLHENYYGRRDKASSSIKCRIPRFASVCDRIANIQKLQLRKVTFQRHLEKTKFVGELFAQDFDVNPPYLLQSNMQLLCSLPTGSGKREDIGADLQDEAAVRQELQLDEAGPSFFAQVGSDVTRNIGAGRTYGQFEWPDLGSLNASDWKGTCPVISASNVVEIVSEPTKYLHAAVRVRPGLEPVLWHSPKSPGFFRVSQSSQARTIDDSEGQVWKAFATNSEAWQFIDRAPNPVLAMDGCYLRKAEDLSWVVVFPTSRDPSELPVTLGDLTLRPRRYLLWPLCHSYQLVNLCFSPEALRVVQLLVTVAWEMCLGTTQSSEGLAAGADKALMELSAISNKVEQLVCMQDLPENDEELVAEVRKLQQYQQAERFLAEVLLRILWKMKSQQRDDLGGLIREESLRRWATMQVPFVHQEEPNSLSNLGRVLQRLLVPIGSKAGIAGSPVTTQAWTQLELMLEACYRGEHLPRERCLAKHIHVTKSGFGKRGVAILQSIYHAQLDCRQPPTVQHFSDSEDDTQCAGQNGSSDPPRRSFVSKANADKVYIDTLMDRDPAGNLLFERQVGHGRPLSSRHAVMTFYDEDLPLYYIQLDRQRLKVSYSSSDGLCLGYLVHKNVLAELLEDAGKCHSSSDGGLQLVRNLRMKFLPWIVDVLRSPLPSDTKTWILRCCERMGMVAVAPYQEPSHVNLAIMAFSLCRCCPAGSDAALFLRSVLMNAWHIPEDMKQFVERKSDVYGIYVVKPGTLQRIQELGLRVAVRDFEREVWQRSMDNSAMYLDIISHFSSYSCFTYVKGLQKLDDILLKWLAEYTRLHPWRFVYLEGVDTSFNFPENRDRCNFRFAPPNPLHSVRNMEDLKKSEVLQARPSHFVSYSPQMQLSEELQDSRRLLAFFAKNFAPDSSTGSLAADAIHQDTMFSQSPPASSYSADFRSELEDLLFGPLPCLVLLVSAPGAGKTHHMSALRGRLEEEMQFDIHEFDGSSDILVTTALAEVLQRTMTSQTMQSQKLLILDEYHMLSDEHKDELFEWARTKLGSELRVVLIANRSDSKDRERLEQIRPPGAASQVKVALLQTRLSRVRIEQVMESRGNAEKWRPAICNWLVASRLLFGEESVSLRLCDGLEAMLQMPEPRAALIELLLHRVPTVSRTSAIEFVDAYLQHEGFRRKAAFGNSLLGFCFRIAMLDVQSDELCSFVEFLSLTPKSHEAPPAVRLLAWACYVMNAKKKWDLMQSLSALWSKRHLFVDQVNFPFELAEEALGHPSGSGPTFSWAGDPSSMRDLVDAVRRGHSVDWAEVHRKVWSVEHIKDSELFAQLLSLSQNPGLILQQVMPSNLCSLLRLSNTAAPTAVQLARIILQHAPVDSTASSQVDRPRCLSLWTVILHDQQQDLNCVDVLRLAGGPSALLEALLWARDWATERRCTAPAQSRMQLLQQLLTLISCCCRNPIGESGNESGRLPLHQLVLLWTGSFGCLLKAATPSQEKVWKKRQIESGGAMSAEFLVRGDLPPALPQETLRQVLQGVADVQADWPQEVRLLWRVLHSRSTAREVSKLWIAAPYMLQDMSSQVEAAPIHEIFIAGIVAASGTLSRSLQRCLLCNSCQVPQGVAPASFVAACADALNELRNADQLRQIRVIGPGEAAVQRIVHEES